MKTTTFTSTAQAGPGRTVIFASAAPKGGAQKPCANREPIVRVGSGRVVRLRNLAFICVAQGGMALVMAAIGTVGSETAIPACYFGLCTFVGAWLMKEEPND